MTLRGAYVKTSLCASLGQCEMVMTTDVHGEAGPAWVMVLLVSWNAVPFGL
jgi:hypothetical protein